jgi:hypothetical protein
MFDRGNCAASSGLHSDPPLAHGRPIGVETMFFSYHILDGEPLFLFSRRAWDATTATSTFEKRLRGLGCRNRHADARELHLKGRSLPLSCNFPSLVSSCSKSTLLPVLVSIYVASLLLYCDFTLHNGSPALTFLSFALNISRRTYYLIFSWSRSSKTTYSILVSSLFQQNVQSAHNHLDQNG